LLQVKQSGLFCNDAFYITDFFRSYNCFAVCWHTSSQARMLGSQKAGKLTADSY
jgi:hypothetical protein